MPVCRFPLFLSLRVSAQNHRSYRSKLFWNTLNGEVLSKSWRIQCSSSCELEPFEMTDFIDANYLGDWNLQLEVLGCSGQESSNEFAFGPDDCRLSLGVNIQYIYGPIGGSQVGSLGKCTAQEKCEQHSEISRMCKGSNTTIGTLVGASRFGEDVNRLDSSIQDLLEQQMLEQY